MTDAMISLIFGNVSTIPNSRYNWPVTIYPAALSEYATWQLGKPVSGEKMVIYYRTRKAAEACENGIKHIVAGLRGVDEKTGHLAPVAEVFASENRDWSWKVTE